MDTARQTARFKALADDGRLQILRLLYSRNYSVQELCACLQMEQSLVSHHLRVLRETGLVEGTRAGKFIIYSLAKGLKVDATQIVLDLECCRIHLPQDQTTSK